MAVQQTGQDEDQIIIEKTQTPPVKSFFVKANLAKHELGLQNRFQAEKDNANSAQNRAQSGLNTQVEGSQKGKGRSDPTSIEEKVHKRGGFQSQGQSSTTSEPKQIVPV